MGLRSERQHKTMTLVAATIGTQCIDVEMVLQKINILYTALWAAETGPDH